MLKSCSSEVEVILELYPRRSGYCRIFDGILLAKRVADVTRSGKVSRSWMPIRGGVKTRCKELLKALIELLHSSRVPGHKATQCDEVADNFSLRGDVMREQKLGGLYLTATANAILDTGRRLGRKKCLTTLMQRLFLLHSYMILFLKHW